MVRILIYYSIGQKTILGLQTEILTIISQKHKLTLIVWFLCGVVVKVSIHKTISKKMVSFSARQRRWTTGVLNARIKREANRQQYNNEESMKR